MLDTSLIKVKVQEENDFYGKFEIEPLDRGYAQTLGNSLRRVLLSSLTGAAVTGVKINGAKHEYTTLAGVEEDVLNVILNLKQLKLHLHGDEKQVIYLNVKKKGVITAGDIEGNANVEILNPELEIVNLADDKNPLSMEITIENGIGYVNPENKRSEIGFIPVDANFSPIERVNFSVGSARVGQITDLDKLTLEIFSKAIHPSKALVEALSILENMVSVIKADIKIEEQEEEKPKKAKKAKSKE